MKYVDLLARVHAVSDRATVHQYGAVEEGGRKYPLIRVTTPGRRSLLIPSGFHGEEPAGPKTLALHLPEILEAAARLDVGLTIYPCINPSGFEHGTRYNASGVGPNNDFMRYVGEDGEPFALRHPGRAFVEVRPPERVPAETAALRTDLDRLAPPDAALDIHQDDYIHEPCFYAYVFGPRPSYRPMLAASGALVRPLANIEVDSGYAPGEGLVSDEEACIEFHDGSITDWLYHHGTPHTAALETTTATPFEVSSQVNLVWIHGFIALAACGESAP